MIVIYSRENSIPRSLHCSAFTLTEKLKGNLCLQLIREFGWYIFPLIKFIILVRWLLSHRCVCESMKCAGFVGNAVDDKSRVGYRSERGGDDFVACNVWVVAFSLSINSVWVLLGCPGIRSYINQSVASHTQSPSLPLTHTHIPEWIEIPENNKEMRLENETILRIFQIR